PSGGRQDRALGRGLAHERHRRVDQRDHQPRLRGRRAGRRGPVDPRRRRGRARDPVGPAAVRVVTWNVNSVKQRMPRFLPWLDQREPDVVCLQETKVPDAVFGDLLDGALAERGYEAAVYGESRWNGVAILSRVGLDDVVKGVEGAPGFPDP